MMNIAIICNNKNTWCTLQNTKIQYRLCRSSFN